MVEIIQGPPTPERTKAHGEQVIAMYLDGKQFAWFINQDFAARISPQHFAQISATFLDTLRMACAKAGNIQS